MNERIKQAHAFFLHRIAGQHLLTGPTPEIRAWLILGRKPRDLAPDLTRKEASSWVMQSQHATPLAWLWAQVQARHAPALEGVSRPEHVKVIRWVDAVMADPERRTCALRNNPNGFGDDIEGSLLDRLDEIRPCDLQRSPKATLQSATERAIKEQWDGPDELRKPEPWMAKLPEGVRPLIKFSDLYREGKEMRHCVASYANRVARGECLILSLRKGKDRSTVEIVRGRIGEHKAARNEHPPPSCVALAAEVVQLVEAMR